MPDNDTNTNSTDNGSIDDEFLNDPYDDYVFGPDLFEGLHYDHHYGEVIGLDFDHRTDEVIINSPAGDELERIDPTRIEPGDYSRVPEEAVENPARWYQDLIFEVLNHIHLEPDENAGLTYVRERVRIVAEDEREE